MLLQLIVRTVCYKIYHVLDIASITGSPYLVFLQRNWIRFGGHALPGRKRVRRIYVYLEVRYDLNVVPKLVAEIHHIP